MKPVELESIQEGKAWCLLHDIYSCIMNFYAMYEAILSEVTLFVRILCSTGALQKKAGQNGNDLGRSWRS